MGPNSCPTVTIKGEPTEGNPSGSVVINESDFDAATMTICEAEVEAEVQVPVAPVAPIEPAKNVAPWATK